MVMVMRLIDADKLDWWYKGRPIRRVIDEAPTIDAVPVVRCKDCKHWKAIGVLEQHWECQIFCGLHDKGYLTGADDFCSYGERREGE